MRLLIQSLKKHILVLRWYDRRLRCFPTLYSCFHPGVEVYILFNFKKLFLELLWLEVGICTICVLGGTTYTRVLEFEIEILQAFSWHFCVPGVTFWIFKPVSVLFSVSSWQNTPIFLCLSTLQEGNYANSFVYVGLLGETVYNKQNILLCLGTVWKGNMTTVCLCIQRETYTSNLISVDHFTFLHLTSKARLAFTSHTTDHWSIIELCCTKNAGLLTC